MSRYTGAGLLAIAALALVGLWLAQPGRAGSPDGPDARPGADSTGERSATPLTPATGHDPREPEPVPEPSSPQGGSTDPVAEDRRRAPVALPPPIPQEVEPDPLPVFGQVFDGRGHPLAGVRVTLNTGRGHLQKLSDGNTVMVFSRFGRPPELHTDEFGQFTFESFDARDGGSLDFAADLFHGPAPRAKVDRAGGPHLLYLPPPEGPEVEVILRDDAGRDLYPTLWDLEPASSLKQRMPRRPASPWVDASPGRLLFPHLPRGNWRLSVHANGAGQGHLDLKIPGEGDFFAFELVLPRLEGHWSSVSLTPETEPLWLPLGGAGTWKPERTRRFRERRSNAHFVHTFTGFGAGEPLGATLYLDLLATADQPANDALYLEYTEDPDGKHRWHYGITLAKLLPSGVWRSGDRASLQLDLAALRTADGPVNLLPLLADGRLDVLIQDDTSVESARLSIRR